MDKFITVTNLGQLIKLADTWTSKEFAFDTEFTNLNVFKSNIIGLSICDASLVPVYIQFNFTSKYREKVQDPSNPKKKIEKEFTYEKKDAIDIYEALPYLRSIFDGASCICANAKVELKISRKYGFDNWKIADDVNLMSWLLNVSTESGLKYNAKKELGIDMPSYEETVGMKVDNINWNKVNFDDYAKYAARDAWATYRLRPIFKERIENYPPLNQCYRELEIPVIYEVANAEYLGVSINTGILKAMSVEMNKDILKAEQEIYDVAGVEFNIGSSKQLAEVLFDRLGYPVINTSEKGSRSVNEDTLKELSFRGADIADLILEYRQLVKLKSTYVDAIPLMVDTDGRLRGSFNQSGTQTGRFSSSNPNLQNQPNNKKYPVRSAFVPKKGYKFLNIDWSTIEIRVMAHESGDPVLSDILNNGRDMHQETANMVKDRTGLGIARQEGKTINFAVLYFMGAQSLCHMLNKGIKKQFKKGEITKEELKERLLSVSDAQKIIDGYYHSYAGFAKWCQNEVEAAQASGWVWTMGGRRRPVFELKNKRTFEEGKRKTINTIIQGGAGDLMKKGIRDISKRYRELGYDANILMYVHDEYVIEVREDQAEEVFKLTVEMMNNIFPSCSVPIVCDGGIFDDWSGLKSGVHKKKSAGRHKLNSIGKVNLIRRGRLV